MTTPTCPICGTKFPGDPCKKCEAPKDLAIRDVDKFKVGRLMAKDGVTRRQAQRQLHSSRRPKKKHGRR